MKTLTCLLTAAVLSIGVAVAQPRIQGAAVNAASYAPPGMPNHGVAQGGMFILKGTNLGACGTRQASAFPLQSNMGGTSIRITVGGVNRDALMIYVVACRVGNLPDQLAAIAPSDTPIGDGQITVSYNNQTSPGAPVKIVRNAFGIFTLNQAGSGPAIVQNFNSQLDQPVNTITTSLRPGQVGIIWGTGKGARTNDAGPPVVGNSPEGVEVWIGNRRAAISYAGPSGCCAGSEQIVFETPAGVEGCFVPLAVKVGDVVSNYTSVAIAPQGGACSDPVGYTPAELQGFSTRGEARIGRVGLTRTSIKLDAGPLGSLEIKTDSGSASFSKYAFAQIIGTQQAFGAVPYGSCMAFTGSASGTSVAVDDPVKPEGLDAGDPITIVGPRGTKQLTKTAGVVGEYGASLGGGGTPFGGGQPDYLEPGPYTITIPGAQVGRTTVNFTIPANLTWTNQNNITTVNRAQGQQVTWTGGDPNSYVTITGFSTGTTADATGVFACIERASVGQFTIPSIVLLAIPASGSQSGVPTGFLSVGSSTNPVRFTATGLDIGAVQSTVLNAKNVAFQ